PEAGQVFVRRGEDKALRGECHLCESEVIPASESSWKRQLLQARGQSTTDGEPTVEGKTCEHLQDTPELPHEPQSVCECKAPSAEPELSSGDAPDFNQGRMSLKGQRRQIER
ncbi:MAG: hypothetical protein ACLP29_00490, partial [Dissulfurispiraceae bacterium]